MADLSSMAEKGGFRGAQAGHFLRVSGPLAGLGGDRAASLFARASIMYSLEVSSRCRAERSSKGRNKA
jgi:hypothetical protein